MRSSHLQQIFLSKPSHTASLIFKTLQVLSFKLVVYEQTRSP